MVHPCIPEADGGTVLHACESTRSKKTRCKIAIEPDDIDQTDGATQLCRECYRKDGRGEPIPVDIA
jgi:hypothetical protein